MSQQTMDLLPPDPEGMNAKRALWAGKAIVSFARQFRTPPAKDGEISPETLQEVVGDLIVDIGHWLDRQPDTRFKRDFEALLEGSLATYREEIAARHKS